MHQFTALFVADRDDSDPFRYAIQSDDGVNSNGYFTIDPVKGVIRTTAALDRESFASVLLGVRAYSTATGNGDYAAYTQVSPAPLLDRHYGPCAFVFQPTTKRFGFKSENSFYQRLYIRIAR